MGPQRGWSLPPSVTTAPLCIEPEAQPRLRLEPPRFNGENASYWIRKIQTYYNHHYTPLDDHLYLTQYLFDHPASNWREYWEETNKGKSWDDFLLAVEQRFDPEFYKPYMATGRDLRKPNRKMACLVANQELDHQPPQRKEEVTQVSVNQFGVLPVTVTVSSNNFANGSGSNSIICDSEVTVDANNVVALDSELYEGVSIELPLELVAGKVPSIVKALNDGAALSVSSELSTNPSFVAIPCNGVNGPDVSHSIRSPQKDPQHAETTTPSYSVLKRPHLEQQSLLTVGDRELFRFEQPLASDGRLIPPRNAATGLDVSFTTSWGPLGSQTVGKVSAIAALPQNNFIASRSLKDVPMEVSYLGDGKGSSATIQFGEDKGVHVFDPGAFDVRVRSMSPVAIFLVLDQGKWNVAYSEPGIRLDSCVDDMLMSSNGVVVAWPFSIIKWFMPFYSATKNWEKTGVFVLVPNDWWHLVTHLEGYVTITKYFASMENWLHVFDLLIRLNPSRLIYGTSDGILWNVHLTNDIILALQGTIDELKMDPNERESGNRLFLDTVTNYTADPEIHKLMELAMSCDYMQVKEDTEDSLSRSFAELGADYGMLELNRPVAPHVVDVLHSYFEFHLEGKVVFNGGGVDRDSNLVYAPVQQRAQLRSALLTNHRPSLLRA